MSKSSKNFTFAKYCADPNDSFMSQSRVECSENTSIQRRQVHSQSRSEQPIDIDVIAKRFVESSMPKAEQSDFFGIASKEKRLLQQDHDYEKRMRGKLTNYKKRNHRLTFLFKVIQCIILLTVLLSTFDYVQKNLRVAEEKKYIIIDEEA